MALNIKNDAAHALAIRLAAVTGESLTTAVTRSLRERLDRMQDKPSLAEELLGIGRDCAQRLKEPYRSMQHGEWLYDDKGLPR